MAEADVARVSNQRVTNLFIGAPHFIPSAFNGSEVIREALRLFEAYEQVKTAKLDSLRQDIDKGLNDEKMVEQKKLILQT